MFRPEDGPKLDEAFGKWLLRNDLEPLPPEVQALEEREEAQLTAMAAAWGLSDSHASESDSDSDSSDSSDDPIGRLDSVSQDSVAAMWDSAAAAMHPNVQSGPAVLPGLAQDPVVEKPLPAIVIEEKPPPAAVVGASELAFQPGLAEHLHSLVDGTGTCADVFFWQNHRHFHHHRPPLLDHNHLPCGSRLPPWLFLCLRQACSHLRRE